MKNVFKYLLIVSVAMTAVSCNQRELNTRVSNTTGGLREEIRGRAERRDALHPRV